MLKRRVFPWSFASDACAGKFLFSNRGIAKSWNPESRDRSRFFRFEKPAGRPAQKKNRRLAQQPTQKRTHRRMLAMPKPTILPDRALTNKEKKTRHREKKAAQALEEARKKNQRERQARCRAKKKLLQQAAMTPPSTPRTSKAGYMPGTPSSVGTSASSALPTPMETPIQFRQRAVSMDSRRPWNSFFFPTNSLVLPSQLFDGGTPMQRKSIVHLHIVFGVFVAVFLALCCVAVQSCGSTTTIQGGGGRSQAPCPPDRIAVSLPCRVVRLVVNVSQCLLRGMYDRRSRPNAWRHHTRQARCCGAAPHGNTRTTRRNAVLWVVPESKRYSTGVVCVSTWHSNTRGTGTRTMARRW